ncbi:MAG: cyclic nucleotide-binding domain-containing protein [Acidimicrobiales bacterium]
MSFGPGHLIAAEGEPATTLHLVTEGRARIETHDPARGPLVVETVGPGHLIGWSWMFPPYRWQFDVRAMEPVTTIAADAACLRSRAEADPRFGYELMLGLTSVMLSRLQGTRLRLADLYGAAEAG